MRHSEWLGGHTDLVLLSLILFGFLLQILPSPVPLTFGPTNFALAAFSHPAKVLRGPLFSESLF